MQNTVAVDTQIMRGINAAAILATLRTHKVASVAEIAAATGLSRQAVTRSLQGLEAEGLIAFRAPDPAAARAGRPAQLVEFCSDAGHVMAVSISPEGVRIETADLAGEPVHVTESPISGSEIGAQLETALREHLDGSSAPEIWHAVIAVPGIVDTVSRTVRLSSSMPALHGDAIPSLAQRVLGCPVDLDNDVKLATEGEQWRGTPHSVSSLVLVEWGDRLGGGLLLNGSLYRGASNDSGDLGFLDLHTGGTGTPDVPGLGPFEQQVGAGAFCGLVADADDRLRAALDAAAPGERLAVALRAVQAGEPAALTALRTVAGRFAKGVAAIRALLDPELIIIGGPMARAGAPLTDAISAALEAEPLNQPAIELSTLGERAVIFGALHHALASVERRRFAPEALSESMSTSTR